MLPRGRMLVEDISGRVCVVSSPPPTTTPLYSLTVANLSLISHLTLWYGLMSSLVIVMYQLCSDDFTSLRSQEKPYLLSSENVFFPAFSVIKEGPMILSVSSASCNNPFRVTAYVTAVESSKNATNVSK
ncbi:hypothetical protein J6590_063814 [Homalodisca vitripennis]|nr:hypothetical protein J6590_063814 [Homalodisca vitripennis]